MNGKTTCHTDSHGNTLYHQYCVLHRDDGPAKIYKSGHRYWYQNGLLHRLDGPAIINPDNSCKWFIYGKQYYDFDDYCDIADINDADKVMLKLIYATL